MRRDDMLIDDFTGEQIVGKHITVNYKGNTWRFKTKNNLRLWMGQRRMLTGFTPTAMGPPLPVPDEIHKKTLEKFGRNPDGEKVQVDAFGVKMVFRNMSEFKAWVVGDVGGFA